MAYYEYIEMSSLQSEEITVLENISMILNEKWNYEEVEETKKLVEMFEDSEDVIVKIMSIKEIDVSDKKAVAFLTLTEEEKRLGMIENPEKWIEEIANKQNSGFLGIGRRLTFDDTSVEMLKALAKFYSKIAVYQFCTVHWPKLVVCQDKINKERIKMLKKELEHWEFCFWIEDMFEERESLKSYHGAGFYGYDSLGVRASIVHGWIKAAYESNKYKIIYEDAKKLRLKYIEGNGVLKRKNPEIRNMRNLLDIMERHLDNNLTPQDIDDLRENMQDWERDIEKLLGMINNLPALGLKTGAH